MAHPGAAGCSPPLQGHATVRILFQSHSFPPDGRAGVERYTHDLAREMQRRGHDVAVLTARVRPGRAQYSVLDEVVDGLTVFGLVQNWPRRALPEAALDPVADRRVVEVARSFRADVVAVQSLQSFGFGSPVALREAGFPVVIHLHDAFWSCGRGGQRQREDGGNCAPVDVRRCGECLAAWAHSEGPLERGMKVASRFLPPPLPPDLPGRLWNAAPARLRARIQHIDGVLRIRRGPAPVPGLAAVDERREAADRALLAAARVVAPSEFLPRSLRADGLRLPSVHLLETGVRRPTQRPPRRRTGPLRLGMFASWVPHKGAMVVADALRRVQDGPEFEVHHWGAAVRGDWKERVLGQAGGRMIDAGELAPEDVYDAMAGLDAVLIPSTWAENAPLVALEARAVAVPVLASDIGGLPEIVEHGRDGWLLAAGSAEAWAACFDDARRDPAAFRGRWRAIRPPRAFGDFADECEVIWSGASAR